MDRLPKAPFLKIERWGFVFLESLFIWEMLSRQMFKLRNHSHKQPWPSPS